MTYKLGRRSRRELQGVHPDLQGVVERAIETTRQDFTVLDGLRTIEEQEEYVRRGVSRTMKSRHLRQRDGCGHAVDLVPYINGKLRWEIDACILIAEAMRAASHLLAVPLIWGGCWSVLSEETPLAPLGSLVDAYVRRKVLTGGRAFIDGPHFQLYTRNDF